MIERKYNDNWLFWEEKNAFALIWNIPDNAQKVTLPHDAMITQVPNADSLNKGNTGFRDGGVYCYVKHLEVDSSKEGQRILMKFEGVYMNAFVYINGELAAKRPYGYSTFYVELDRYITYDQPNEIRVFVRNGAMTNSRWYSGSGIYRDVYLLEGDRCHIVEDSLRVATEYVHLSHACISVDVELSNLRRQGVFVRMRTVIYDHNDTVVAEDISPIKLYENERRKMNVRLIVPDPDLWSDETPELYRCVATVIEKGQQIDDSEVFFGIRTITVDAASGLLVNGKSVKLRGVCLHHDSGILGAATYDAVKYRQIRRLKESGINAIRMAHNPMSQAMLRACDQLGMYVMDEAFDMWSRSKSDYDYSLYFDEWWEKDVEAMVAKDFNHPSVILYSTGNEIPELGNRYGVHMSQKIAEKFKKLDPTRYTLTSVNGVFATSDHAEEIAREVSAELMEEGILDGNVNDFMALMGVHMDRLVKHSRISEMLEHVSATGDVIGYNYMGGRYKEDSLTYPNRVIVGSETYPPAIGREWQLIMERPNIIGDFSWTGWDYILKAGVGLPAYRFGEGGFGAGFPCQLAYCGDMDLIGNRRPASYYREIVFGLRQTPYTVVVNPYEDEGKLMKTPWVISDAHASWNYEVDEGTELTVEIYAPGDEVELLLNGERYGRVPSGPTVNYISRIKVPYRSGTLTTVAYENGQEIGRSQLKSYDDIRQLSLIHEKIDGMVFVEIKVRDGNGSLIIGEDDLLTLKVAGGQLIGFGSGNPKPNHGYTGCTTSTYQGAALAVVKADGIARISVQSEKFGSSILEIH